jgi:hypothetical protein
MKKRLSALFVIILILGIIFSGCKSKEENIVESKDTEEITVVGTWKIISASDEASGLDLTGEQLEAFGLDQYSVEFKEDGTLTAVMGSDTSEGTYTFQDTTVTADIDGKTITAQLENNQLTFEESGATIVIEKDN